jgi:parallel beta-helix repeat protein
LNNKVANNQYGIKFSSSDNNVIHNNAFTNNTLQVISSESINFWNDAYPLGGNYWSNHLGTDLKSGPNQNLPGSDGIEDTPYIIDTNNTDRYPLMNPVAVHDVTVNLTTPKTVVGQGYNLYIRVQVTDKGNRIETVNITVFVNTTLIAMQIINLTIGTTTLTFTWNTTSFAKGKYIISAKTLPVPGETNTTDNFFQYGDVIITVPGDTDGNRDIDIYDIVRLASVYDAKKGEARFNPNCDIDGNDEINIYDVVIATSRYGYKET